MIILRTIISREGNFANRFHHLVLDERNENSVLKRMSQKNGQKLSTPPNVSAHNTAKGQWNMFALARTHTHGAQPTEK